MKKKIEKKNVKRKTRSLVEVNLQLTHTFLDNWLRLKNVYLLKT